MELRAVGKTFTAKDSEKIKDRLLGGVKEVTRDSSAKSCSALSRFRCLCRAATRMGSKDGTSSLLGAGKQEFSPGNLFYDFEEKFSLAGLFQRIDNFLAKGLDEAVEAQRENARQERAELETVNAALGKGFPTGGTGSGAGEPQRSHQGVQRMQDDTNYVSTWTPKTTLRPKNRRR